MLHCLLGALSFSMPTKTKILITGATSGIGEYTARRLAESGFHVLLHGRSTERVEQTVKKLRENGGSADGFVADLSLLSECRRLGSEIAEAHPVLHGLLNNAGTFDGDYTGRQDRTITTEGNEYSLAVNVLAPFLLSSLLLPSLLASGAARLILTSSISAGEESSLNDLQCEQSWDAHRAYSLSKLCDAMLAMEMHARYGDPPRLCIHTMDPGTVDTKMLRAGWGSWGAPVSSATRSYELLTSDKYGSMSGAMYRCSLAGDVRSRAKLWRQCEELTGAQWPAPNTAPNGIRG
jgi:NAD(P)-dependent dehydrogenase (short-subunit alcohol dehydrogenase family)